MSRTDLSRRAAMGVLAGSAASGCAVLSAPDPVSLFRFGQTAGAGVGEAPPPTGPLATVLYNGASLPRAAATDRILTSNGVDVSYVGGSRWVSPALILFEEAAVRAFNTGVVRLVRRGAAARADATLRIEVLTFEARYSGPEVPPLVVVQTRALLTPIGGVTLDEQFASERQTTENRVAVIAAAFDAATSEVLDRIVSWTRVNVRPASPA